MKHFYILILSVSLLGAQACNRKSSHEKGIWNMIQNGDEKFSVVLAYPVCLWTKVYVSLRYMFH